MNYCIYPSFMPGGKVQVHAWHWRARMACWWMRSNNVAIVFGSSIYLWGVSSEEFIRNERWVNHELAHVRQYLQLGTAGFLKRYLFQWIKTGYYKISLEIEAREAEKQAGFTYEVRPC